MSDEGRIYDDPAFHEHRRSLLWLAVAPLIIGLLWLGALQYLGTTSPIEATVGRSMEPTLQTGDLAVMEGLRAQDIRLGDIVGLDVPLAAQSQFNYPARVLHRVIDMRLQDGVLMVQTQGDGQARPDPFLTPAVDINRRLIASVPKLGNVLFYLQSPQGKIAIIGLLVLFMIYEAVRWATDTAEEMFAPEEFDPDGGRTPEFQQLAHAIGQYGEHLRSHTKVIEQLGGTTEELHGATEQQREVLTDLGIAVTALAERVQSSAFRPVAPFEPLPPADAPRTDAPPADAPPEPASQARSAPQPEPAAPPSPVAEPAAEVAAPAPPAAPAAPAARDERADEPRDEPVVREPAPPPLDATVAVPGRITLGVVLRAAGSVVLKRALSQIEALDARLAVSAQEAATPAIPRPPREARLRTAARSAAERDRVRRYRPVGAASVRAMAAASQNRRQHRRRRLR